MISVSYKRPWQPMSCTDDSPILLGGMILRKTAYPESFAQKGLKGYLFMFQSVRLPRLIRVWHVLKNLEIKELSEGQKTKK